MEGAFFSLYYICLWKMCGLGRENGILNVIIKEILSKIVQKRRKKTIKYIKKCFVNGKICDIISIRLCKLWRMM